MDVRGDAAVRLAYVVESGCGGHGSSFYCSAGFQPVLLNLTATRAGWGPALQGLLLSPQRRGEGDFCRGGVFEVVVDADGDGVLAGG